MAGTILLRTRVNVDRDTFDQTMHALRELRADNYRAFLAFTGACRGSLSFNLKDSTHIELLIAKGLLNPDQTINSIVHNIVIAALENGPAPTEIVNPRMP